MLHASSGLLPLQTCSSYMPQLADRYTCTMQHTLHCVQPAVKRGKGASATITRKACAAKQRAGIPSETKLCLMPWACKHIRRSAMLYAVARRCYATVTS